MKRINVFVLFILSLALITGCTITPVQKMMQRDPKFLAPTQKTVTTRIVEMVTATSRTSLPASTGNDLTPTPEWQRISTADGMVSLELPGDWTPKGGDQSWQSPDGKLGFNILRFRAQPESELDASLIPGKTIVREIHDFMVKDRSFRQILVDRVEADDTLVGVETHYLVRRMDGKEVFDFSFSAQTDAALKEMNPSIQHTFESMIWAMID